MEAYPNAKVLLTVRDPEKWYDSAIRQQDTVRHVGLKSPETLGSLELWKNTSETNILNRFKSKFSLHCTSCHILSWGWHLISPPTRGALLTSAIVTNHRPFFGHLSGFINVWLGLGKDHWGYRDNLVMALHRAALGCEGFRKWPQIPGTQACPSNIFQHFHRKNA